MCGSGVQAQLSWVLCKRTVKISVRAGFSLKVWQKKEGSASKLTRWLTAFSSLLSARGTLSQPTSYFFKTSKEECLSTRQMSQFYVTEMMSHHLCHILWVKSKLQVPSIFKVKRLHRHIPGNRIMGITLEYHTFHRFNLVLFHIIAKTKRSQYISQRIV